MSDNMVDFVRHYLQGGGISESGAPEVVNETLEDNQTNLAEALELLPAGSNSRDVLEALSC